ncbi:hypothetical protein F2P45_15800 [Massilia sp. CCM 8733]|uniref:Uncharacterized protein n=1 Tax=Massilia mucilaginosa TaxID=2609282 RepID=A0ABX0NU52_9BURK|nr:hypothetical protein [Massilia mucilaginosa]NHZ90471.1 hypothetical protein [Massilia mucilaginosa]
MKKNANPDDLPHFVRALEEHHRTGANTISCDTCHAAIRFHERGTVLFHECDCGRFTGTLRGL